MSDGIGPVTLNRMSVMEDRGGMNLEEGVVAESLAEVRDMFFGDSPLLKYDLSVRSMTRRGAELKARSWVRAKNPFSPSKIGVGRVSHEGGRRATKTYRVTVNVRG